MYKIILPSLLLLVLSNHVGADSRYGPYDYTNPEHKEKYLKTVEDYHFTDDVKLLRRGKSGYLWGDIGYVLYTFPNHHLALDAMTRLHFRKGKPRRGAPSDRKIQKYFTDAIAFSPHDHVVNILYGIYLYKSGRLSDAETQYKEAIKKEPQSSDAHYNLGLLYFKEKKYKQAKASAEKAYALGYPLPGLRDRLKKAGMY